MCLGASNVSFGLPERFVLNAAFLPMAMAAGLTSAIMSTRRGVRAERARGRPAARPRRLGRELDRRPPRAPGGGRGVVTRDPPSTARQRVRLRFEPDGADVRVPERHADLRRRELERHRDRLDVRRPRHVQEVQGADRRRRRAGEHGRPARVQPRRAARRLAAGLPRARARGPRRRTCRRCRRGRRRRWSASAAT